MGGGTTDAEIAKKIVGQWQEEGHIRVFYGDGSYFVDPEPEGRPLGKWSVHNKVLFINWPPGAVRPTREPIAKITEKELITYVDRKSTPTGELFLIRGDLSFSRRPQTYDPLNRVITRNINGAVTQNVWEGWNLIEEHRPDWSLQRCYLQGANQNEMVAAFDGNVYSNHWYWQDGRGNTSHITGDNAYLLERYTYDLSGAPTFYDEWGNERWGGSVYDTRFLFAGSQYCPRLASTTCVIDSTRRRSIAFFRPIPSVLPAMRSTFIVTAAMTRWIGVIRWG